MTLTQSRPPLSAPDDLAQALIEEARRRHRRRRAWTAVVAAAAAAVAVLGVALASGGFGAGTPGTHGSSSGGSTASQAPPLARTADAPASPGIVGTGATSIDFLDADHGWIATGANLSAGRLEPTIVRTDDGGRTWRRVPGPKLSVGTISWQVLRAYGGVVIVRFANATHGWYLQAGELWQTTDGGARWRLAHLGVVRDVATSPSGVWALADGQTPGATDRQNRQDRQNNCTQVRLLHQAGGSSTWRRYPKTLSTGGGPLCGANLTTSGDTVFVSVPGRTFVATEHAGLVPADPTCEPVGVFADRQLVGLCDMGGGGDASATHLALSTDHGRHWTPFASGPPSQAWVGANTTNGGDAMLFITGGTTLWRIDSTNRTWAPVLQTPTGSTDELYPIAFADPDDGLVFQTGSTGVHLFATHDAGLTWHATPLP